MKFFITQFALIISILFWPSFTFSATSNIEAITQAVTEICSRPSNAGKYWDVAVNGKGEAKIKLLLAKTGVSGDVTFNKGEWEGTKNTIENSKDYRQCAKELAPKFIAKFENLIVTDTKNENSRSLGGVSWREVHNDLSAELKRCEKSGTNMICHFVLEAINTDQKLLLNCQSGRCPAFDQDGNTFSPTKVSIANHEEKQYLKYTLVQGVPTKSTIRYSVYNNSQSIPKIALYINSNVYSFRNMSVEEN